MKINIDALFSNDTQRKHLSELFALILKQEFRGRHKAQLVAYMAEDMGERGSISAQQWAETLQAGVNECWAILYALPDAVSASLEEALDDLTQGACGPEELAQRCCQAVVTCFVDMVSEQMRDRDYAGLRQAIARKKDADRPLFYTRFYRGLGTCFSPQPVEETVPQLANADITTPPTGLGVADAAIRKQRTVAAPGGSNRQMVWDTNVVAREAQRFWQAFVDERYDGVPGYVPIFAMYCWLCRDYALGSVPVLHFCAHVAADDDTRDTGTLERCLTTDDIAVEDAAAQAEILLLAEHFANDLADTEAMFCAWGFEPGVSMERLAHALGLAGPSSLSRHKNRLVTRLRERATQLDDVACAAFFVSAVQEACKKRCPAPTEVAEVLHEQH
ncbi:MAG: hypothetical protein IJU37_01010 [Desulfovibrio sp.]|nr:hypothetical protein [Desulfovibrio sp.]